MRLNPNAIRWLARTACCVCNAHLLQEKLNKMMRKVFAASSEVMGTHQKDMFFNEAEALGAATKAAPAQQDGGDDCGDTDVAGHKRVKRGRKPLAPALPRHIVRHELSGSDRICAHDGCTLVEIGVEASEQLDIIPQQVRVIRHERVKYACPCCDGGLRLAGKPAQIIPKGLFSEAALAWIATSKFDDGLPLYRQAALLGRFGGTDLSRNTCGRQHRARGGGHAAGDQPDARPLAGLDPGVWR